MILLYAPRLRDGEDYQRALEAQGFEVVRAASVQSLSHHLMDGGVDLVILDDPPWEMTRGAVAALDAALESVPRIWVSSWPEAPAQSGKLGVDALLIDPHDVDGLVSRVRQLLAPRSNPGRGTTQPILAMGSQPGLSPRGARPTSQPPITLSRHLPIGSTDGDRVEAVVDEKASWEEATDSWSPKKLPRED